MLVKRDDQVAFYSLSAVLLRSLWNAFKVQEFPLKVQQVHVAVVAVDTVLEVRVEYLVVQVFPEGNPLVRRIPERALWKRIPSMLVV